MNKYTNKAVWPMLLLLASLYGCSTSPATRLYVIESLVGPANTGVAGESIVIVGPVTLPERLNRREILTHSERYRMSTAKFDRWAEPLDENITRAVVENLSVLSQFGSFLPYPSGFKGPADFTVRIVVHEFGDTPDGKVVLSASWALVSPQSEQTTYSHIRLTESRNDGDVVSMVAAMSRLVEGLSREIALALDATSQ